jgi:hypothetical protein
MSRRLFGFIDETKAWQADLVDTLYNNKWQPDNPHDTQLFARQLVNGALIDREQLSMQYIYHLLRFHDIAERHAIIASAHKKTFDWIFHHNRLTIESVGPVPPEIADKQGSFMDWLLGDQCLYWITGKPGSGKSTLMKYLFDDKRTFASASCWSKGNELITAGFFFWNSGTSMQMSSMGLLQALLHQCLQSHNELIPTIFPTRWINYTVFGGDASPFTWLELTNALKTLISMKRFNFLLFIDGLDEFDGPPSEMGSLVLELGRISPKTIKLCVSSRPWLVFEESFRHIPFLRMEDLTRRDIQLYVEDNMRQSSRWNELHNFMPDEAAKIVSEITDKAVGVFLWVVLVVTSLLNGLRDGDSIDDLWGRLSVLPSDLEDLFKKILDHLNPEYFVQACELFQLVLFAFEPPTLLNISLALDSYTSAIKAPPGQLRKEERSFRAETMRRRIMSRCKGLLESPRVRMDSEQAKVEYLHRTVRDFFETDDAWTYIRSGAPGFDAPLHLAASYLWSTKMANTLDEFWHPAALCVEYARRCAKESGSAPIEILAEFSSAGDEYWDRMPSPEKTLHWVNTIHAATPTQFVARIQTAAHSLPLSSFFDFAVVVKLNSYLSVKLTTGHTQNYHIGFHNLLCHSLNFRNYDFLPVLLENGASPNASCGPSRTPWKELLNRSSFWTRLEQTTQRDLCNAAELYLEYDADLSVVDVKDFDTVLSAIEPAKRAELLAKVKTFKGSKKQNAIRKQGGNRGEIQHKIDPGASIDLLPKFRIPYENATSTATPTPRLRGTPPKPIFAPLMPTTVSPPTQASVSPPIHAIVALPRQEILTPPSAGRSHSLRKTMKEKYKSLFFSKV